MNPPTSSEQPDGVLHWLVHMQRQLRCLPLLLALVIMLLLYPYLEVPGSAAPLSLRILLALVLLTAVFALSERRWTLWVALALLIPAMIQNWTPEWDDLMIVTALETASLLLFYAFTIGCVLAHVLRGSEVTVDKIYGSIGVYLLLGFAFAEAYRLIETLEPGSFFLDVKLDVDGVLNWSDLTYYSFVTLTTLGYGDIVPITSRARSISILEATTGVMFLAVLVARLVGGLRLRKVELDQ